MALFIVMRLWKWNHSSTWTSAWTWGSGTWTWDSSAC